MVTSCFSRPWELYQTQSKTKAQSNRKQLLIFKALYSEHVKRSCFHRPSSRGLCLARISHMGHWSEYFEKVKPQKRAFQEKFDCIDIKNEMHNKLNLYINTWSKSI